MKKAFIVSSFVVLALALPAHAIPSGKRLIETGLGKVQWMTQQQIHALAKKQHESGRCGGYLDVTDHADFKPTTIMPVWLGPDIDQPKHQEKVEKLLKELSANRLHHTVERLSRFPTRYYDSDSGKESALWIKSEFERMAGNRSDIRVDLFQHNWKQPSIVATIQGNGPLKDERVILGGHQDSINQSYFFPDPSAQAPGADDDASGISTLMEVFRVLAESGYRPNRTIQFIAYAAEEVGLKGSQDIARRYKEQGVRVVAVAQFDMTFYPGGGNRLTFINDNTHSELTRFSKMLVDTYVKVPWIDDQCGYACSDHASWFRQGFATVFPFEAPKNNMNRQIHTTRDTLENSLNSEFGLYFAQFGLAFAVELGS